MKAAMEARRPAKPMGWLEEGGEPREVGRNVEPPAQAQKRENRFTPASRISGRKHEKRKKRLSQKSSGKQRGQQTS